MEYIIDEKRLPWSETPRPERRGMGFFEKFIGDGLEGRPFAVLGRQPVGYLNPAHLHTEHQFLVLLEGSVGFPRHPLLPIAVHYTDAYTPYGPFRIGEGMIIAVLRCRKAGQLYMTDPEGRKRRNPLGREFFAQADQALWETVNGDELGVKRKPLLKEQNQPQAELRKYPPEAIVQRGPAPFGRFQVVLEGSAQLGDNTLTPYSMLFDQGDNLPSTFRVGKTGATIMAVSFDRV